MISKILVDYRRSRANPEDAAINTDGTANRVHKGHSDYWEPRFRESRQALCSAV
jgi:hypothetical protein